MSTYDELLEAASELLLNAMDTDECFAHDSLEDDNYPLDEAGRRWLHDWWALRCAVLACRHSERLGDEIIKKAGLGEPPFNYGDLRLVARAAIATLTPEG